MNEPRYAADKPAVCDLCYFWNKRKKACSLGKCYYLLPSDTADPNAMKGSSREGECRECPYGRHFPCIGYCLLKIIREMKLRV